MEQQIPWYAINNINEIDSPALVLYPERIVENIRLLKNMVDVERLRPHVKTNKCMETASLMMREGITKFKCATIAEAEMLAMCNVKDVLLAYQPVGPRIERLMELIRTYPGTTFSCLTDNISIAQQIEAACARENVSPGVYIDIDVGMHRTGIEPGEAALELYAFCARQQHIHPLGLHVYDGHLEPLEIEKRTIECDNAFAKVEQLRDQVIARGLPAPVIVAGGSPTLSIHAKRKDVVCSPGTFIYWDRQYLTACPELPFQPAAVLITRVTSLPGSNRVCLDLGHKSVASENELDKRAYFLDAPGLKPVGHSEEHLMLEAAGPHGLQAGDVLYALPYHICPTVALHERSYVAYDHQVTGEWKHIARDRRILH
jgi:D-serine deaminase-like pyridoxal phosphate-dependent protein